MKWLKRKIRNWLYDDPTKEASQPLVATRDIETVQDEPILNFRIYNAVGGKVVEFSRYDKRSDRRNSTTYIITNDQDFGERIAKISTMEHLKS